MSVRQAVVKAEEAAAEVAAQPSQATVIRQAIDSQSDAFRQVLPRHVDPERFSRLVLQAIKSTPELMNCFATQQGGTSVLLAAMQAAAVGIEPNTPAQEGWLLPRKNKGVWEAQLSIGYRGFLKLARRSGTVKTIYAEVVRERDHFVWSRGLESDTLEHIPFEGTDAERGELTHAYAVVRYVNGGYDFRVLTRSQVEARRALSDSWRAQNNSYSPWVKWPEAMWRKTAIRSLVPSFDLAPNVEAVIHSDERSLHFDDAAGVIEVASAFGELEPSDSGDAGDTAPAEVDENGELPLEEGE